VATFLLLIAVQCLLAACSPSLQVRSDSDPSVDFGRYTTFNFFDPMGIEGGYNSPIFGQLFRESITSELEGRRYVLSDSPDLLVNVTLRTDDQVRMTAYTAPYLSGAYYNRPGGAYYGSALGVGLGVGQTARSVTEASVFIDLVDPEKRRVVWQGVAVFDATEKVATQLRNATFTAVEAVFRQYPHQAGQ
jgi:hypothetical protein